MSNLPDGTKMGLIPSKCSKCDMEGMYIPSAENPRPPKDAICLNCKKYEVEKI